MAFDPINQPVATPSLVDPTSRVPWMKENGTVVVPQTFFVDYVPGASQVTDSNQTIAATTVLQGLYIRSGMTAARTDTLPSAANLVAAVANAVAGSAIWWTVLNANATAITLTIAAGAGGTLAAPGTYTVPQSNAKGFLIVITNATPGSEAYTVYSLGAASAA
jgi:hypothetical protein